MLAYRHAYHAGNFADVFKHIVLTMLLAALRGRGKPFVYVDTHAGSGRYDLRSAMARKNREYESGVARLWPLYDVPEPVGAFLDIVRALNALPTKGRATAPAVETGGHRKGGCPLRWYPGSPRLARAFVGPRDRMLLAELHPSEFPLLRREFAGDRRVRVFAQDGYHLLRSKLPPREHRGLVLIDPAYERREEPACALRGLEEGYRRFATGTFALWYPIMPKIQMRPLHSGMIESGIRRVLLAELCIYPDDNPLGLNGSGLLIVNPPWRLEERLRTLLPWLWRVLSPAGGGRYRLEWLVPE